MRRRYTVPCSGETHRIVVDHETGDMVLEDHDERSERAEMAMVGLGGSMCGCLLVQYVVRQVPRGTAPPTIVVGDPPRAVSVAHGAHFGNVPHDRSLDPVIAGILAETPWGVDYFTHDQFFVTKGIQ